MSKELIDLRKKDENIWGEQAEEVKEIIKLLEEKVVWKKLFTSYLRAVYEVLRGVYVHFIMITFNL